MTTLELGIVGLGSMGENLGTQALERDVDVVGVNPSERPELEEMGATVLDAGAYGRLADVLEPPRVVLLALHAGEMIDEELDDLLDDLEDATHWVMEDRPDGYTDEVAAFLRVEA